MSKLFEKNLKISSVNFRPVNCPGGAKSPPVLMDISNSSGVLVLLLPTTSLKIVFDLKTISSTIQSLFIWHIELFLLLKGLRNIVELENLRLNNSISDLWFFFSYFSCCDLFNKHNFEMAPKRTCTEMKLQCMGQQWLFDNQHWLFEKWPFSISLFFRT